MKTKYSIELTEDEMIRYYANKIVEDALSDCSEYNYCLDVDSYNDNGFVEFHQDEILDRISKDERVAEVYIDKSSQPHSFDMIFLMDYCPYYYEENELHPQTERTCLKLFLDKIKELKEYIHIRTTRDIIRSFMNSYIESDDRIDFDDKDEVYYSLKEHLCNTGFIDKYIDKYEVYVTKDNINELINLLEKELSKSSIEAYESIDKISRHEINELINKLDSKKAFEDTELNCFICEEDDLYLMVDNTKGKMIMEIFDDRNKCLDAIGIKEFYYTDILGIDLKNEEAEDELEDESL